MQIFALMVDSTLAEIPPSASPLNLLAPDQTAAPQTGVNLRTTMPPSSLERPSSGDPSATTTNALGPTTEFASVLDNLGPMQTGTASGQTPISPANPAATSQSSPAISLPRAGSPELTAGSITNPADPIGLLNANSGTLSPAGGNNLPLFAPQTDLALQQDPIQPASQALDASQTPSVAPGDPSAPTRPPLLDGSLELEELADSPQIASAGALVTPANPPPAATSTVSSSTPGGSAEVSNNMAPTGSADSRDFGSSEQHSQDQANRGLRVIPDQNSESGAAEGRNEAQKAAFLDTLKTDSLTSGTLIQTGRLAAFEGTTATQLNLSLPADKANWAQPLADRISMLIKNGSHNAELRLSPPHLGRLEIQLSMNGDQASIVLSTSNPEIREALTQTLPRLDALLQNSGLKLADSQVTDHGSNPTPKPSFSGGSADVAESGEPTPTPRALTIGLIDTYA